MPVPYLNWANARGLTYPLLLDTNRAVYNQYSMGGIPLNTILDSNSVVLYTSMGYDRQAILSIIDNYLPTPPAIQTVSISNGYMIPSVDTLIITTQIENQSNFNVSVKAMISILDSAIIDSIQLFDDGLHDDGQAGDLLYGGYLPPISEENDFSVGIKILDLDNTVELLLEDQCRFTTIGPLELDSYVEILRLTNRIYYQLIIANQSQTKAAQNISVKLTSNDPNVINITGGIQNFGTIPAGQTAQSSQNYGLIFNSMPPTFNVPIQLEIYSNGYLFWRDSSDIVVGIEQTDQTIPANFELKQNYPNPFNPATTIDFALPRNAEVSLRVYDILGKEVATLISRAMTAGPTVMNWMPLNGPVVSIFIDWRPEIILNCGK